MWVCKLIKFIHCTLKMEAFRKNMGSEYIVPSFATFELCDYIKSLNQSVPQSHHL